MGGKGFLGAALTAALRDKGVEVTVYTRAPSGPGEARWAPLSGEIDPGPLSEACGVVNLSGENLAGGRWDVPRKQRFVDSRVKVTAFLCRALSELSTPPKVLVNASAVGFYGDRGEVAVSEESAAGGGFLAELCDAWEQATAAAAEAGIRVVLPRFGVMLGHGGGLLDRLLTPFRLGAGGRLGSGRQFMPWIAMPDAVSVVRFLLQRTDLSGPVNAVAPEACTNAEFSATLAQVLHRPALLPVPAVALRAVLGEMADELLLQGANVRPHVLERAGFRFEYPRLVDALCALLEQPQA